MASSVGGDSGGRPRSLSAPASLSSSHRVSAASSQQDSRQITHIFQNTVGAHIQGSIPLGATVHGLLSPSATVHGTAPSSIVGQGNLSITSDRPAHLLALCQKCKLSMQQAGKGAAEVKTKLNVNDLADLIMQVCSAQTPRIELSGIEDFSIAFAREKMEIVYNQEGVKQTAHIDLTSLMKQLGDNDIATICFRRLYEVASHVKGFEDRLMKGQELVADARSSFVKTGSLGSRAAADITGPLRLNNLASKDFLKKTASRSDYLIDQIHQACGGSGPKASTSLETHFKKTLAQRQKMLLKLMQKITDKQKAVSQAVDEAQKQNLGEQIRDLEKMKSFLAIEPIQEIPGISPQDLIQRHLEALKEVGLELKVAIALMIQEQKDNLATQTLTVDQKVALAQKLEAIYLGQKAQNAWDRVKGLFGFTPSLAPRIDAASLPLYISDIEQQNIHARYKKSAKQMAADTVALLFDLEKDTPTSLVKDSYKEFSDRLQTAQEPQDIADVLFKTSNMDDEDRASEYRSILKLTHLSQEDLEEICHF